MELSRGQGTLHIILCSSQHLVRDVNVTELLRNHDLAAIYFAMHVGDREHNLVEPNFPRILSSQI